MEEDFSPAESLHLIQSMIGKAKTNLSENRFYFLFWGWITFVAFLSQFVLKTIVHVRHHEAVWLVIIPAVIVTSLYSAKRRKDRGVKTYIGESMGYLWSGIGISFFILSIIISRSNAWVNAYAFFILLYGLGTFISGRLLRFPPLIIGGIINWILAIVCCLLPFDYQLLVAAVAILTSYIIPGYLLAAYKR